MEWLVEGFLYVLVGSGYGWIIVGLFFVAMGMFAFAYGNMLAWVIFSAIGAVMFAIHWWSNRRKRNEIND